MTSVSREDLEIQMYSIDKYNATDDGAGGGGGGGDGGDEANHISNLLENTSVMK